MGEVHRLDDGWQTADAAELEKAQATLRQQHAHAGGIAKWADQFFATLRAYLDKREAEAHKRFLDHYHRERPETTKALATLADHLVLANEKIDDLTLDKRELERRIARLEAAERARRDPR